MCTIGIQYDKGNSSVANVVELIKRHRSEYFIDEDKNDADIFLELIIDRELEKESYYIKKVDDIHILVCGADTLGLVYGVGRVLHRGFKEIKDEYCIPKKSIRAIYYATHFNNFYQTAPLDKIIDHMEEQMLWGCNCICTWFDMHHFQGIDSPEAARLISRIYDIFSAAKKMGLKTSLMMLANEYYQGGPKHLLAENSTDGTGYSQKMIGFYGTEVCTSTTEGEALIINSRREMLQVFKDVELDFFILWPYDQGGCTCPACRPWGSNGFLKISKKLVAIIRELFPEVKYALSTWRFDSFTNGEWDAFLKEFDDLSNYFDYLLVDFASETTPVNLAEIAAKSGVKLLGFPDISMFATPWGGFGAAPAINRLNEVFMENEIIAEGGFCYSEGIFEDINKMLMLSLYMGNNTKEETMRDYFRFYFGEGSVVYADEFLCCLEKSLFRQRIEEDGTVNDYPREKVLGKLPVFKIKNIEAVERAYKIAKKLCGVVSKSVAESERFQMFYLRTVIDLELVKNRGELTDKIEEAAVKLKEIYYAEDADYVVSPIMRKSIIESKGLV